MISGILNRLAAFAIFTQLSSTGWIGFVLLSFLPFFGYTLLGWNHAIILSSFFIDRIVFVFFFLLAEKYHLAKSNRLDKNSLFKDVFAFLVTSYMLLQFLGLILSLTGLLREMSLTQELLEMTFSIFIVYLVQWLISLKQTKSELWVRQALTRCVTITISSAFIFMIAFFAGVFLKSSVDGTFLANFFQTGYGIIIFVMMSLRLLFDVISFKLNKSKAELNQ